MSTDVEASDVQDGLSRASEKRRWSCSSSMCNSSTNAPFRLKPTADLNQPRTNQPCRLSSDTPDLSQMQVRHCYSACPPCKVVCTGVGGGHAICQHICINVSQLLGERWHSLKQEAPNLLIWREKNVVKRSHPCLNIIWPEKRSWRLPGLWTEITLDTLIPTPSTPAGLARWPLAFRLSSNTRLNMSGSIFKTIKP